MKIINKIYLDMDGVLADFDGHFLKLIKDEYPNISSGREFEVKYGKDAFWKVVHSDENFFLNIEPFPHYKELYELCLEIAPVTILSAPSSSHERRCINHKMQWLDKHGINCRSIFNRNKGKLADHYSLLVDDYKKNIRDFYLNNGMVHHFRDFNQTKRYLNEIIIFRNYITPTI